MTRIQYIPQVTSDGRHLILRGAPDPPGRRLREWLREAARIARGGRRRQPVHR
jgi:hypothetical protein